MEPSGSAGENCTMFELEAIYGNDPGWWNDYSCDTFGQQIAGYICSVNGNNFFLLL